MRLGICTFSDGRKRAADATREDCLAFQARIAGWLRAEGHTVVEATDVVWNLETIRSEGHRLVAAQCDAVIFNFSVWSFPDFTVQVALQTQAPLLLMGNINPSHPGWVAFFASAGALDEVGRPYGRALGDISDSRVQDSLRRFLAQHEPGPRERGRKAARSLRGLRYGEFDGPSMGMYTGHLDQSQWLSQFGVHVFHRSQLTLAYLADQVAPERVAAGLEWLERHVAAIHWDGAQLTPGLDGTLARQVRLYLAVKDFCRAEGLAFCGLTGQLDFTEWEKGCTMDVPEALLNDIADWEEERKQPVVCATECDSNGALTMQMLHLLSGDPVLFADLRHYHEDLNVYDLVNSGQHAPWLARRSDDYAENLKEVHLRPASPFYFRGGGASVQFLAAPAEKVTFARLTRRRGAYRMHMFTGSFVRYSSEEDERLARLTTYEWPHAFARFDCPYAEFVGSFSANHLHAAIGDHVAALKALCEEVGIEPILLG
jgi:L-fucose isomerase